jgi:hypothetical protein
MFNFHLLKVDDVTQPSTTSTMTYTFETIGKYTIRVPIRDQLGAYSDRRYFYSKIASVSITNSARLGEVKKGNILATLKVL